MPKKIRQLKSLLQKAGWVQIAGGKGSHTKWQHRNVQHQLTLSGNDGKDAKAYQEKQIAQAIRDANAGDR